MKLASLRQFLQDVAAASPLRGSLGMFEVGAASAGFHVPLVEDAIMRGFGDLSPEAMRALWYS